ncbi:putative receptor-like protein kinase [Raphanus sativus]|nr:putative receptor-like protein kinase [Raphanus sativus]
MEDKKANIIATISILALIIVIIVARVSLKLSKTFYLIAGVDISLILAVICFLIIRRRYNRERKILVSKYVSEGRELRIEYSFLRKVAGVPTKFKLEDLEEATDGFRIQIGKGGSGSVFKGVLKDGSQVAVKRIEGEEKGEREFRSEVAAIASVQHKNLVRLYGYSSVNRQRFLVYAYVPNSSLDHWIFPDRGGNRRARGCLTWDQRYQVAVDVAKALAYLHHDCRSKILHLDVKPENILLDEDYRAVVTDFGLSKLIARDVSRVVTEIRGTCGYLAPEWLLEHGISEKSDVYSYGIVLLEMIGGRRSIMKVEVEETNKKTNKKSKKKKLEYFPRIVNQKMRERKIMEIVDQRLELGDEEQVMKLVCVALWCIQEKAKNRPDMAMVIEMLEGRVPVSEPPDSQLVVVDLLAAGDDDDDGAPTGVRRVVEPLASSPSINYSRGASSQHCLSSEMSISGAALGSGRILGRAVEFGKTHVVRPKGKHQATIVWLHGLGDNGSSWSQLLETLPLPNIKWICPTAPSQPISLFGGFPSTAWFDVVGINEDGLDDVEGLDGAAAHVANLLSNEPGDIKLGVGGFSMGAGTSLYSATCFALGKYGNGNPYPINLSTVIGLSGWLPCAKTLTGKLEEEQIKNRAASLPILVCHGKGDDVVPYKFGEKSSQALISHGFKKTTFKAYTGLGHYTIPQEMNELCSWLTSNLGLEG